MFNAILDNALTVWSVLAFVGLVSAVAWWRTRRREWLFALGGAAALAAVFALLDAVVETRHEQITRKLREMAAAVETRQPDRIAEHLAANFRLANKDKEGFRLYVADVLRRGWVDRLTVWDFAWPEGATDTTCPVEFNAKPQGPWDNGAFYLVRARFVREPGDQWRMQTFDVFNPVVDNRDPLTIPNLP